MAEEEIIEPKKEEKKKGEKKPKSRARKIIEWVLTGFFVAIFGFVAVVQIIGTATKNKNNGVPNYGGYQVLVILTDSMEPQYKVNGAVIVKKVDPSKITLGDNVTFMYDVNGTYMPMTHQISDIKAPTESDPHWHFEAHGINTASTQCKTATSDRGDCTYQRQYFTEEALMGKVVGYSMALGVIFNFMITPWGLLLLLLLPALYLIVSSVIDLVKAAKMDEEKEAAEAEAIAKGEKPASSLSGLSEEDIKRLKEEMLNEMLENKNKESK
ncbi:MAG: hypothetical protein K6F07_03860 [Bacilli bacterium]|nr:hypothetical protein [Bacilli bacterium]